MTCISSVSYRINVNGQQGNAFEEGRGLKQGDPLSPLLFVLSMEYFTRLMKIAGNHPQFFYLPNCKQIKLNHLMFADDVILFCKAHPPTLHIIMNTLQNFQQLAGLQANQAKPHLVCGGCDPLLQKKCLDITGYQEGALPMRYLGVPITGSKLSKMECRSLVEKIMGKIKLWFTRNLSFAGRAQLLSPVIFGMYNFWASIFILPQEVID